MAWYNTGEGTPWAGKKYTDPGQLTLEKDPSKFQGYNQSTAYAQLLESMKANRQATQGQSGTDPYAASRASSQGVIEGQAGHQSMGDQRRAMGVSQNQQLQDYLDELERNRQEEEARAEQYNQFGRTAQAGGKLALDYYSGGATAAKKKKPTEADDWQGQEKNWGGY